MKKLLRKLLQRISASNKSTAMYIDEDGLLHERLHDFLGHEMDVFFVCQETLDDMMESGEVDE